jgi:hypothetical protein
VTVVELKRGFASFALDTNLEYDPLLLRYAKQTLKTVKEFGAQIVHVTGPGDLGCLGLYVASKD